MRIPVLLAGLVAAAALAASPAYACKGKNEIFNADLTDEDGLVAPSGTDLSISKGKAVMKVAKGKVGLAFFPDDITDADIDLCVTYKGLKETDENAAAALVFWADQSIRYLAMVFSGNQQMRISTLSNAWKTVTADKKTDYKKGAPNTIRITLKGNEGVAFVNDKQIAKFKRKDAPDSFAVGVAFQSGDFELSKLAGTD